MPAPVTYEALSNLAKTILKKQIGYEPVFQLRYQDIDRVNVVVEDDSDLDIAYTLALSGDKKIVFHIQETEDLKKPQKPQSDVEMVEMIDTEQTSKKASKQAYGKNGIPRKALRTMIKNQMENQAKTVFDEFIKDKKFD